ncbi:alpha/beta hydrolase [Nonomuraea muscovyensis]|uniref:alpha/beta fold hydrolase n=1 Tax=Nonomuraea muscovyensis TaxID=1124761 RepID=UPI0033D7B9A3|nr:alpha/beta hydrolase [Nonomuraea muscovyensis]
MAYLELPDGVPLYYEDRGSGPAVLLIHGWTMNSTFWGQNAGPLSETNRVITVDLRGHGLSGKTDEGHTLDQYARDVRDLLVHLGVRDVCMVGWSMGTAVILAYVRQFGCDLMRSAAFVDQSPRFLDGEDWDFPLMGGYSTTDLAVFTQGMRYARPSVVKPFIAACFAETPPAEVVDAVYAETTKMATSAALSVWYDMAYADLRPVLPSLSVPTLLMYGTRSKIFPGRLDDWLAEQLPQAQVARFDNSGHAPFSEEPDRFNEILNVFLRS